MKKIDSPEPPAAPPPVLAAFGRLDAASGAELFRRLRRAVRSSDAVLDLRRVDSLSSSGLGAILAAMEEGAARGYRLRLEGMNDIVRLAIESSGVGDCFGAPPPS